MSKAKKKAINKNGITIDARNNKKGYKGDVNNGDTTNVDTQFRKRFCMMTKEEIIKCGELLRTLGKINRSRHLIEKDITIDFLKINKVLRSKHVLNCIREYNERYIGNADKGRWEQRVLIKLPYLEKFSDSKGVEHEGYLSVVLNITTAEVVTCYYNKKGDNHSNFNRSKYCTTLIIRDKKVGGYTLKEINEGLPKETQERFYRFLQTKNNNNYKKRYKSKKSEDLDRLDELFSQI